jgi:hypothetical protein
MNDKIIQYNIENIQKLIYRVRGLQIMLDSDLAELYDVEVKVLNQAVKRNITRFPSAFMFQLAKEEYDILRSQNVTLENNKGKHRKYLPYAFTEQGVAMLSAVLKSETAINVSIRIISTFVEMRKFLIQNSQLFQRLDVVEKKQLKFEIETENKFEQIFDAINNSENIPKQGIFFDGQIFDAYKFVCDIIRKANKSILLIDNYIDDSVLEMFIKRKQNVEVVIYIKSISKQLSLDLKKYNAQYPQVNIKEFVDAHDRFLIIDEIEVYHIGASLKDLGKKWIAFSKFEFEALKLLEKLKDHK